MEPLDQHLQDFPLVQYKKGEIIVSQGEIPKTAFVIQKGLVKIYNISSEGDEMLVDFDSASDIFPDAWVFGKAESSLYFYETLTDCSFRTLPREKVVEVIAKGGNIERLILDRYISNYIAQTLRINALTYSVSIAKLLHTLRYLCIRFGKKSTDDLIELEVALTHQQIAELVGLSRETTTKSLIYLKSKKVVSYDKRRFIVNIKELINAIGDTDYEELNIEKPLKFPE